MEALKLYVTFCVVSSILLVKSASVPAGSDLSCPNVFKSSGVSAVFLSGGPSGGGPPPTKNPFVNKSVPASRLSFKFTEEELKCKMEERESLQKDIWMVEKRLVL